MSTNNMFSRGAGSFFHHSFIFIGLVLIWTGLYSAPLHAATNYQVAAGGYHTCAVFDSGLQCWGRSETAGGDGTIYYPTQIPAGLTNVVQVATGGDHTCAIGSIAGNPSEVHCWGANWDGQAPPNVTLTDVKQLALGVDHSCALLGSGSVSCWGAGYSGGGVLYSPPDGLNDAVQIAAGATHTCALRSTGTVTCWGGNYFGQSSTPPNLVNVMQIATSKNNTCALNNNGVYCWGATASVNSVPTLFNPSYVAAGGNHVCAIDETGLVCWGDNGSYQTNVPSGLVNVRQVTGGWDHTCALDDIGVHCWGADNYGQSRVPPANLSAIAKSRSQIDLSWTASTNTYAAGYILFRCVGASCTDFLPIRTIQSLSTVSYSDTGLAKNRTYRYCIQTYDMANNVSACSNIASATTPK